jgi:murein DD-endopeptidase MepM/ murein hydrolase activator NlpD
MSAVIRDPVDAVCISSPFGWRHRVGPMAPAGFHNGIDLPAPAGAAVHAAAAGRISRIERKGIGGLQVFVAHPGGLTTLYAHLGSVEPRIAEGATTIAAGDTIGRIGRTGVTYGTHLFFAVFAAGRAIDPDLLLGLPLCGSTSPGRPR